MKLSEIIAAYKRGEVIEYKYWEQDDKSWRAISLKDKCIDQIEYAIACERIRIRSKPKQIDLSVLAEQQVLCEFSPGPHDKGRVGWLCGLDKRTKHTVYTDHDKGTWTYCQPLFNYEQVYKGQTFPEGLVVEYGYWSKINSKVFWCNNPQRNTVWFRITGIKEGYTL